MTFSRTYVDIIHAGSLEEPLPTENHPIRACCSIAEILHRGRLVDRTGLPSVARIQKP